MTRSQTERGCRDDLIRRVLQSLDHAEQAVQLATSSSPTQSATSDREPTRSRSDVRPLVRPKVLAEVAMLLRGAAPISSLDPRIDAAVDRIARLVGPAARGKALVANLCTEPGLALDHAMTHVLLRDLGYPDSSVDQLLGSCLGAAPSGSARPPERLRGPERLPHRELEQRWLARIWSPSRADSVVDAQTLARTALSWPLDVLSCSTDDLYAVTHAVLYASDLGRRHVVLPRPPAEIVADAEAGLAVALDADNFDLAAELLWTWPMLRLAWNPIATFAWGVLTARQDALGFLPGPGYSADACRELPLSERADYVLETSYHSNLVIGLLASAALTTGSLPLAPGRAHGESPRSADQLTALLAGREREAAWQHDFASLDPSGQHAVAPLVLTIALRRARDASDLAQLREGLRVALEHDWLAAPAPRQALALLKRSTLVGRLNQGAGLAGASGRGGPQLPVVAIAGIARQSG